MIRLMRRLSTPIILDPIRIGASILSNLSVRNNRIHIRGSYDPILSIKHMYNPYSCDSAVKWPGWVQEYHLHDVFKL